MLSLFAPAAFTSLAFAMLTPLLHTVTLLANNESSFRDPLGTLSQGTWGNLHTAGILLFGTAQILLAVAMSGFDQGRLWPFGRLFLGAAGATLVFVAYYFATVEPGDLLGLNGNDPLVVVATLTGTAMGLLQPGCKRLLSWLGVFNAVCLGIWLLLIPAILLIDVISPGVYERTVGAVYVIWVVGMSYALMTCRSPESITR